MTQLALPLVSAFLAFVAGLLFGLRAEWVTGGIALAAVPLPFAPGVQGEVSVCFG